MNRRSFLEHIIWNSTGFSFLGLFSSCMESGIRFGLLTDLHYANRSSSGNRYYKDTFNKLKEALAEFERHKLDFIIELGDMKDQGNTPNREETLGFLQEIETVFQSFPGDIYHVLGNHDMDSISKQDFLSYTKNSGFVKGKNYYSFVKKGVKFIVLDANYRKDGTDYNTGNFNWEEALIPKHEVIWLEQELQEGNEPVVVFIHQLLDTKSGLYPGLYVLNAVEIQAMLVKSKRVLAVFQGHHHAGSYTQCDGIHYFTMPGMIEGNYPDHNAYAIVEITPRKDILIDGFSKCQDKILRKRNK